MTFNVDFRKPLTNNRDLLNAFKKGYLEEVAEDLFRYQTIDTDKNIELEDCYQRTTTFKVKHSKGVSVWTVIKRKGELKSVGIKY